MGSRIRQERGFRRTAKSYPSSAVLSRKGFVFSLDIMIAVFLVILIMSAAHLRVMNSEANRFSRIQMTAMGSDVTAVLDYTGTLQTLDDRKIESGMHDILPSNYNMRIRVTSDDGAVVSAGDDLPDNRPVAAGKRFFTIKESGSVAHYGAAEYWIWTRDMQ